MTENNNVVKPREILWAVEIPPESDSSGPLYAAYSKVHADKIVSRLHGEIDANFTFAAESMKEAIKVAVWTSSPEAHLLSLNEEWWTYTTFDCHPLPVKDGMVKLVDINRLVHAMNVAINGDKATSQATLSDIAAQVVSLNLRELNTLERDTWTQFKKVMDALDKVKSNHPAVSDALPVLKHLFKDLISFRNPKDVSFSKDQRHQIFQTWHTRYFDLPARFVGTDASPYDQDDQGNYVDAEIQSQWLLCCALTAPLRQRIEWYMEQRKNKGVISIDIRPPADGKLVLVQLDDQSYQVCKFSKDAGFIDQYARPIANVVKWEGINTENWGNI